MLRLVFVVAACVRLGAEGDSVEKVATVGRSVTLSASAGGSPPLHFQWLKNGAGIAGATGRTLVLSSVTLDDAGVYSVIAWNPFGSAASNDAVLTVIPPLAPTITGHPATQTVTLHSTAVFTVAVAGSPALMFQWRKDNIDIPGATDSSLVLPDVNEDNGGIYSVVVTNDAGSIISAPAVLTVSTDSAVSTVDGQPDPAEESSGLSRLTNVSVRSFVGAGKDSLIVGFVVSGSTEKPLLLRGIGPGLSRVEVGNFLADPVLALYSGSAMVATNDNWSTAGDALEIEALSGQIGAFSLSSPSRDAAFFTTLAAGPYVAQLSGSNASGIALMELYEVGTDSASRITSVFARATIDAPESTPVMGFVVAGTVPKTLLFRALGPALAAFDISGVLDDPQIELFSGATRIQGNDDWGGGAELTRAFARVGAFAIESPESRDAALLFDAYPGAYTVIVSGANRGTGVVVVEMYEVP